LKPILDESRKNESKWLFSHKNFIELREKFKGFLTECLNVSLRGKYPCPSI